MQQDASRPISIIGTNETIATDTVADDIKQKNLLSNLLRLAKEQSMGVARKVENLIQGFVDGKLKPEIFTSMLEQELGPFQPDLDPLLKEFWLHLQKMEVQVDSGNKVD